MTYVLDCMKDADPTYRLRVNVDGFAIISYGNKTTNIYVKKLHSLYRLCKGDFVVGDITLQISPLQNFNFTTTHCQNEFPTDSVMTKLNFVMVIFAVFCIS